ncbi:MAG: DUF2267 domain-containing protein [Deltaproteobacteria bacterium]|nr:DUF2267 domain-containing protein [Deltaproteobacteria bacterium]
MPYPPEYERAGKKFTSFLTDVKKNADFGSSHMAYTMAQGVFQVFRRRLSLQDAIKFTNILPAGIRALFVAEWNPEEEVRPFGDRETMIDEVRQLRPDHNFSTDNSISEVAAALRKHVDEQLLDETLATFPRGAMEFWKV